MNNWISGKLVKEGMRQLRLAGIIALVIAVLVSFFTVLGVHISSKSSYEYATKREIEREQASIAGAYEVREIDKDDYVEDIPAEFAGTCINIVAYCLTPLMCLIIFSFLNKRNASDFYHAIMAKRQCVAISFSVAVFLWIVIVMISSFGTILFMTGILSFAKLAQHFASLMVYYILQAIVVTIYMIGLLVLSMSLSGTLLTNLAVAAMILFLPKIVYFSFMGIVVSDIDIYPFAYDDSIFSGRYNLVTGLVNYVFIGTNYEESIFAIVYTLVMGLALFVAGCIAFKLRKSEAATQAAVTGKLQLIFRLIPAFVVTIFPCSLIYEIICNTDYLDESMVFGIIVLYVIAIVVYFLYEVITTKKWRNIIKAVPGLLILLVLNVCFIAGMFIQREYILGAVPEKTTSVKFLGTRMSDMNTDDYFLVRMAEFDVTDSTVIQMLEDSLKENIQDIRNDSTRYYQQNRLLVQFNENGKKLYRLVFVDDYEYAYINRVVGSNGTASIITDIAKLQYTISHFIEGLDATDAQQRYLLEAYMQSVESLQPKEINDIIMSKTAYNNRIDEIYLTVKYKGKNYNIELPILYTMDVVPKYIELRNSCNSQGVLPLSQAMADLHKYPVNEEDCWLDVRVEYMQASLNNSANAESYIYNRQYYANLDEDSLGENMITYELLTECLEYNPNVQFEAGKDYVEVYYNITSKVGDEYLTNSYSRIYVVDPELKWTVRDLLETANW